MKYLISILFFSICVLKSNCQITKGYWLVNGNANFSTLKNSSTSSLETNRTDLELSAGIGYFIIDKLATGLRPSISYGSNNFGNSSTIYNLGPFVRYYFLDEAKTVNILTDLTYSFGSISGGQNLSTVSFLAGPVVYFNNSVGLEFLLGYSSTKVAGFTGRNRKTQIGIGFQFHFEKE